MLHSKNIRRAYYCICAFIYGHILLNLGMRVERERFYRVELINHFESLVLISRFNVASNWNPKYILEMIRDTAKTLWSTKLIYVPVLPVPMIFVLVFLVGIWRVMKWPHIPDFVILQKGTHSFIISRDKKLTYIILTKEVWFCCI